MLCKSHKVEHLQKSNKTHSNILHTKTRKEQLRIKPYGFLVIILYVTSTTNLAINLFICIASCEVE